MKVFVYQAPVGEGDSLAATARAAARAQRAGDLADWLGCAKNALQVGFTASAL